jgi:hypothetical protein
MIVAAGAVCRLHLAAKAKGAREVIHTSSLGSLPHKQSLANTVCTKCSL